jgi:hypothetical protein
MNKASGDNVRLEVPHARVKLPDTTDEQAFDAGTPRDRPA